MKVIAGLGNPGRQYQKSRHNVGFCALDYLADQYGIDVSVKKHQALCGKGIISGQKVLLVKPQTFMNLSGESLRAVMDFYKILPDDFIIIYDDIDLDPGQMRIRRKGSAGGHNGMKSIIAHLGTQEFPRIKLGVGAKPQGYDLADYVLGKMPKKDRFLCEDLFPQLANAVEFMVNDQVEKAMNEYN